MTLGVCIIALCGLTMLAWLFAVHSAQNFIIGGRFTPSTEGSMVLAACGILLGFGILLRRETARALYLYVAVFLLALTVYNTYTFQRDARVINLFNKNEAADVDRKIVQYQNSPMYVSQLKAEKAASSKAVSLFYRHALPLAAAYGASILPLIFLNLPRVKDAFDS